LAKKLAKIDESTESDAYDPPDLEENAGFDVACDGEGTKREICESNTTVLRGLTCASDEGKYFGWVRANETFS